VFCERVLLIYGIYFNCWWFEFSVFGVGEFRVFLVYGFYFIAGGSTFFWGSSNFIFGFGGGVILLFLVLSEV
jgi:hypothetical protein